MRHGIGSDPRIGYHFIYPGAGYGGSCFPKDVKALIHAARERRLRAAGARTRSRTRNDAQKDSALRQDRAPLPAARLAGQTFALWGLAFKPNTDDMREAASRVLMEALWEAGAKVQAFDPEAMEETQRIYGDRDDLVTRRHQGGGADGRRRAGHPDRVAGVPRARLRR